MTSQATVTGAIAERYATALYELAEEQKALDKVAGDLEDLKATIVSSDDLRRLLRSPLIGRDAQGKAMDAILGKAQADDLTRRFVGVVIRNRRLFALEGIIDGYLSLLAERRGEVTAQVTSAAKLTEKQLKAVTDALRKVAGAKVRIDQRVDPGLIGGLIVKVGSRMIDSSLRTKLQRLQLSMKGIG